MNSKLPYSAYPSVFFLLHSPLNVSFSPLDLTTVLVPIFRPMKEIIKLTSNSGNIFRFV